MADAAKNRLAAQMIKAEMLGDVDKVSKIRAELDALSKKESLMFKGSSKNLSVDKSMRETSNQHRNNRVNKFLGSTSSLGQMFAEESRLTASDEAKMFIKTSAKFSREDMETKYFSEERDDSQMILNKSNKRHKPEVIIKKPSSSLTTAQQTCDNCIDRIPRQLLVDQMDNTYMSLLDTKPHLSTMSNVVIRNKDHNCVSFVDSSHSHQYEVEKCIEYLRAMWSSTGYKMIIMETYLRNRKPGTRELSSCGNHFQVHCLPIKEKHFEKSRMYFKQSLLSCEKEWSLNKKLTTTDCRKIQRYVPKGLSYFWVCFNELTNGFAHVIENEIEFSRYFGLEVLAGLLDKDFNTMKLNQKEEPQEQFDRCKKFRSEFMDSKKSTDGSQ